jgi:F0F1-type ATP synthase assembly protein I
MKEERNEYYYAGLYSQLGFLMVVSIVVFMYLGMFLDDHFGQQGLFSVIMTAFGMIGGGYLAYFGVLKNIQEE